MCDMPCVTPLLSTSDHRGHLSLAYPTPTQTNTDKQETHVRRGHPVIFGLILFFALIEGCITAWLGTFIFPLAACVDAC
jgi:hypothetical protein